MSQRFHHKISNRLSSTIGGSREMDQLYISILFSISTVTLRYGEDDTDDLYSCISMGRGKSRGKDKKKIGEGRKKSKSEDVEIRK